MVLYIMVSKHQSHVSVYGVRALFTYFQVSEAAPISRPGSQAQPWRGQRRSAVGSSSEEECGPLDSSSLGDEADADTISVYLHTGITVKSGDEILVPLASGIKLIDSVGARILFLI